MRETFDELEFFALERLELSNFRLFDRVQLELHPQLTVIIAPNGGGKSSLLDGIALAYGTFVGAIGVAKGRHFQSDDAYLKFIPGSIRAEPQYPVQLKATGLLSGVSSTWVRELRNEKGRSTYGGTKDLLDQADMLTDMARNLRDNVEFPLIVYYGTERLWKKTKLTEGKKSTSYSRMEGYTGCLDHASNFKSFEWWLRGAVIESLKADRSPDSEVRQRGLALAGQIQAINRVVSICLKAHGGWESLDFDHSRDEMTLYSATQGTIPLGMVSDGIRAMLTLISDLAFRTILLNPHMGSSAPENTRGVVAIDEIDMHLHPEWQQAVVPSLLEAFPNIQFVMTTHSPQILTTVSKQCIRVLERDSDGAWVTRVPAEQTKGLESSYVMASTMDTDSVPDVEEARWLSDYKRHIIEGTWDSADGRLLRAKLESHFGKGHQALLECQRLIRLEDAKRRAKATGGNSIALS